MIALSAQGVYRAKSEAQLMINMTLGGLQKFSNASVAPSI
jgi:hypothetical protein